MPMNKQSVGLWLTVGVLTATFIIFYLQQTVAGPVTFAGKRLSQTFLVGSCPAPAQNIIYGWGNRAVGQGGAVEFGCFDAEAGRIVGVKSLEECLEAVCELR